LGGKRNWETGGKKKVKELEQERATCRLLKGKKREIRRRLGGARKVKPEKSRSNSDKKNNSNWKGKIKPSREDVSGPPKGTESNSIATWLIHAVGEGKKGQEN